MNKVNVSAPVFVLLCLVLLAPLALGPAHAGAPSDENLAIILGEAGERYPIFGTGGIKVSGGHHGFWSSNMKRSSIEIDGSGISPQKFAPINESSDFTASANSAYFVSGTCICALPPARSMAGQEILVCNTNEGTTITYQTSIGDRLFGGSQLDPTANSILGKVDRFISDGRNWYKE